MSPHRGLKTKYFYMIFSLRATHSFRCGKAALSRLRRKPWMYVTLSVAEDAVPPRDTVILPRSTRLNMYARMVACVVKPAGNSIMLYCSNCCITENLHCCWGMVACMAIKEVCYWRLMPLIFCFMVNEPTLLSVLFKCTFPQILQTSYLPFLFWSCDKLIRNRKLAFFCI